MRGNYKRLRDEENATIRENISRYKDEKILHF